MPPRGFPQYGLMPGMSSAGPLESDTSIYTIVGFLMHNRPYRPFTGRYGFSMRASPVRQAASRRFTKQSAGLPDPIERTSVSSHPLSSGDQADALQSPVSGQAEHEQ